MKRFSFLHLFICCMCTFILCILITVAPLNRLAGTTLLSSIPLCMLLTVMGTKLPTDLHLTADTHASQVNTDTIEFLSIMVLVYLVYAICAYIAYTYSTVQTPPTAKRVQFRSIRIFLQLIWIGAILIGIIYVLTPSMLSRDASAYASYGRIIVTYHANPYYTPLSAFPHDPFFQLDDWRDTPAAYGPLWLVVCAISTFVAGSSILHYIFFYRILGLIAHLINIVLVTAILRKMKRSPRIVVLGILLYAWNPLVLLESCLGGHNDIVMVTCILVGILLCIRVEQDIFFHARYYLPPAVAFTCAALIKFTAAPIIAFYLVLLAGRVFANELPMPQQKHMPYRLRELLTLRVVSTSALVSGLLAAILYIPLWLGHTIHEIGVSLGSLPSSRLAFGSILLALQKVVATFHGDNGLLAFFSKHSTWSVINIIVVVGFFGIGALWIWHVPTTRTMVRATLATLGALLIVTPWFFPWYVIWLVSLAVVSLPDMHENYVGRALMASTFTFSASALLIYLFRGYPPIGDWIGFASLTTIGPPLIVFLFFLLSRKNTAREQQNTSASVETANQLVP